MDKRKVIHLNKSCGCVSRLVREHGKLKRIVVRCSRHSEKVNA